MPKTCYRLRLACVGPAYSHSWPGMQHHIRSPMWELNRIAEQLGARKSCVFQTVKVWHLKGLFPPVLGQSLAWVFPNRGGRGLVPDSPCPERHGYFPSNAFGGLETNQADRVGWVKSLPGHRRVPLARLAQIAAGFGEGGCTRATPTNFGRPADPLLRVG